MASIWNRIVYVHIYKHIHTYIYIYEFSIHIYIYIYLFIFFNLYVCSALEALRGRTHPGTGLAPKRCARSSKTAVQEEIYRKCR